MPRVGFTVAVLGFVATLSVACDMDPHRIGVEYTEDEAVVIHLANCDDYRVHRVALSFTEHPDVRSIRTRLFGR